MAHFDPTRPDFSPYGFSCVRWTPEAMPRSDRHNEIELNLLERGTLTYLMGGRRVVVPAGRLTAFWAGVPHQVVGFEGLSEYYVLTIPLVWFLQWRLLDAFTQRILHGAVVVDPDDGHGDADRARLAQWSDDAQSGDAERLHACLLETQARLRRLALQVTAAAPRPSRRTAPAVADDQQLSLAEAMAYFIAQHFAEPLTAERIGRHVGLHPNYAMALFRQTFGTTLIRYLTQHRLAHAQRLLVTTRQSIAQIAFGSGFGSLSRFNEAFREAFGCTPRAFRSQHPLT